MRRLLLAVLLSLPATAFAVGFNDDDEDDTPPTPTVTTTECEAGTVHDPETDSCVAIEDSRLDDDALYRAVRELAYAGRTSDALAALRRMSDQDEGRVLTYLGFVHRRMGDREAGLRYYRKAIALDPDNLLARSYMAQGFVEEGLTELARAELSEIRARGGRGSWAEVSLRLAIQSGRGYSY